MPTPETHPETTPVIVGVGEFVDRTSDVSAALEPLALMALAMRAADADGGGALLGRLESVELVGTVTWRYIDPIGSLCAMLGIDPARKVNASMGGETPIRLIHEAAIRIARGELAAAAIVGGEAMNAMNRARRARAKLEWTPLASKEEAVRFPARSYAMSDVAKALGIVDPAQIYPFYEMATQAAWGQTPAEGHAESARLWSQYASVAAGNPSAWIRNKPSAEAIANIGPDNRLINWPYPKLMVANPSVNQAAAVIVTSVALARAAGVAEEKLVYIWGGAAAKEPDDYLRRDRYDHSTAQTAVLRKAVEFVGGDARAFDRLELYSCFPVVPKMALRTLGLDAAEHAPTVTGGLTFFGGPLNNYMSHAASAMVRALRAGPSEVGLLYGQGGYVNKHHALIVSARRPPAPLALDYSVQTQADEARGAIPPLAESYAGPAAIETYTIVYGRDGEAVEGIVIARTPEGGRTMARVPASDRTSLALLQSMETSAVGAKGQISSDPSGKPVWEAADAAAETSGGLSVELVER